MFIGQTSQNQIPPALTGASGYRQKTKEAFKELYAGEDIKEKSQFFLNATKISTLALLATGAAVTTYKAYDAFASAKTDAAPAAPPPSDNTLTKEFQDKCPAIDLDTLHLQQVIDLCQEPSLGPTYCAGHQGVPRIEMPQVSPEALNGYIETLQTNNGTAVEHTVVPSSSIIPFQNEQRMVTTLGIAKSGITGQFNPCNSKIIVAGLNDASGTLPLAIVDGHHRGTACKILGGQQKVVWIKADPATVITDLNNRPDVSHEPL